MTRTMPAIKDGDDVWVEGAEGAKIKVKAMVTRRVAAGVAFTPFHFGGHFEGKDLRGKYPAGRGPLCARRGLQHGVHLRLRLGDADAGNQMHPLSHLQGLRRTQTWQI